MSQAPRLGKRPEVERMRRSWPIKRHPVLLAVAGAAMMLAGCMTVGPDYHRPTVTGDRGYVAGSEANPGPVQTAVGDKVIADWWTLFQSPKLDQLIREAIAANPTLEAARARLIQARDAARAEGGLVSVDLTGGVKGQRVNLGALSGGAFTKSFDGISFPTNPEFALYSVGGAVSYNLDLFGGARRLRESLRANADAQARELDAAYLTLTGQVVEQALIIGDATIQIRNLEAVVASDEEDLAMARQAESAGGGAHVQIAEIEGQLAQDRAAIPAQKQRRDAARHRMAALVGRSSAEWAAPDFDEASGVLPQVLPVSMPSALVRNRPDILEAEARLHAATAEIGVATAALYPNITLSADLNQDALSPLTLFSPAAASGVLGAGLAAPLYHNGELRARKREAEDAARVALANYRQTILAAFNQVADLLQAIAHDNQAYAEQTRARDAAEARVEMLRKAQAAGGASAAQLLHAERDLRRIRVGLEQQGAGRFGDSAMLLLATASVPSGIAERAAPGPQ
jgi:NodT family efflux transporter outer membrane factor (OMF) lipoprotein